MNCISKFVLIFNLCLLGFVKAYERDEYSSYSTNKKSSIQEPSVFTIIFGIIAIILGLINVFKVKKFDRFASGSQGSGLIYFIISYIYIALSGYMNPEYSVFYEIIYIVFGLVGFVILYNHLNAGRIISIVNFGIIIGFIISSYYEIDIGYIALLCTAIIFLCGLVTYCFPDLLFAIFCSLSGSQAIFQSIAEFASIELIENSSNGNAITSEGWGILGGSIVLALIGVTFQICCIPSDHKNDDIEQGTDRDFNPNLSPEEQK